MNYGHQLDVQQKTHIFSLVYAAALFHVST